MGQKSPAEKLVIFLLLFLFGMLLGNIGALSIQYLNGVSFGDLENDPSIIYNSPPHILRISLFVNQFFSFIFPSILFGIIFYKKEIIKGFDLNRFPPIVYFALAILFLFVSYPIVNLFHYINMQIPLADWMYANEQNVAEMLKKIIQSDSYIVLGINILLISLLPALGEELVFRGITQKYFEKLLKNAHIAIWLSAFIFSLIHMQFEGLLARMALGAILGYSYYLTRNFWIPVFLHFLNNLLPLLALALMDIDLTDSEGGFNWQFLVLSVLGLPILFYLFKTYNVKRNEV